MKYDLNCIRVCLGLHAQTPTCGEAHISVRMHHRTSTDLHRQLAALQENCPQRGEEESRQNPRIPLETVRLCFCVSQQRLQNHNGHWKKELKEQLFHEENNDN